ncbi:hypothetical protein IH779_01805 [Patescibacteria group bacterium]|nr:hypothetical protein [Patescibacteria group bacterium]
MSQNIKTKLYFTAIGMLVVGGCFFSSPVYSATLGESKSFYIDSSYDISGREKTTAVLQRISNRLYFYIDNAFWAGLSFEEKNKLNNSFIILADEFERKIYPTLTSTFGFEWKPGIDNDERITVLIHPMKKNRGGYFRTADEYSKLVLPTSNEREMVYLNQDSITSPRAKSFLAHEFMHLITFNQKERILGIEEDVWLNETRAEYITTLLGYDSDYQGSNLELRVQNFLENPSNSLIDWDNSSADYAVANLFAQYLVDHYGVKVLTDSLRSSKKGIDSIDEALSGNGFQENFSQVFTDWTIAVLVNDCALGPKYCYKNSNLKNLKVVPATNFLPLNSQSVLSVNYITKNWAGNWQRIIGGGGLLTLDFNGGLIGNIKVPYVVCKVSGSCSVDFLALDDNQIGKIKLQDFNTKYASLTIIPSAQENSNSNYYFVWEVIMNPQAQNETELINQFLAQIESLRAEITKVQAQIDVILGKSRTNSFLGGICQRLENNLYFGLNNNPEVRCLQEFLKNQGLGIYPEGLVTGNFLSLTRAAVIRFQEKYAVDILTPWELIEGTGFVGRTTRVKINQLLGL